MKGFRFIILAYEWVKERLPLAGIVAFSGCSVHAVAQLLLARAQHPNNIYYAAAGLVEVTTAWLVYGIVGQVRAVTRSRVSKQDRRFHRLMLAAFVVLAVPSLVTSVVANTIEFRDVWLGLLFPALSVACAAGAALPQVAARYEQAKATEKKEDERRRNDRERERRAGARRAQLLASMGKAAETYALYEGKPGLTQANAAQELGISRQAVGQHLVRLEQEGVMKRNGGGWEVVGKTRQV